MASPRPDHPFLSGDKHDDHYSDEENDDENTKHFDKYKVDGFLKIDGFSYKNSYPMASGDSILMINNDVIYQSYTNLSEHDKKARLVTLLHKKPFPVILFDNKTGEVLDYLAKKTECTMHDSPITSCLHLSVPELRKAGTSGRRLRGDLWVMGAEFHHMSSYALIDLVQANLEQKAQKIMELFNSIKDSAGVETSHDNGDTWTQHRSHNEAKKLDSSFKGYTKKVKGKVVAIRVNLSMIVESQKNDHRGLNVKKNLSDVNPQRWIRLVDPAIDLTKVVHSSGYDPSGVVRKRKTPQVRTSKKKKTRAATEKRVPWFIEAKKLAKMKTTTSNIENEERVPLIAARKVTEESTNFENEQPNVFIGNDKFEGTINQV